MKVLFIYPPVTFYGSGNVEPHLPTGLAALAAYVEREGHDVKVLDALAEGRDRRFTRGKITRVGLSDVEVVRRIRKYQPDVVGISVMFTAFAEDGVRMARLAKRVNKKIVTVLGGAHVSIDPKSVAKKTGVDVAVKGEGEEAILKIIKIVESGKRVKGVIEADLIKNVDDLPVPGWHLFNLNRYKLGGIFSMRSRVMPLVSSRGCPNHCVYCSIHAVWRHKWRGRSPKLVVNEIEYLTKNFGAREIAFQDDSISVDGERLAEICDEIVRRKIDIKWTTPNGIAHWTLNKRLLKKMKCAGCYRITFGIESGDEETRRWVGKPYDLKQAMDLIKYANKLGMWTLTTNILGFPFETREQINKTVDYAIKSDCDWAFFFRLGPRPGTPVYEVFKKNKWLPDNVMILFSEEVGCRTANFSPEELVVIQREAYRRLVRHKLLAFISPLRILRKCRSLEDITFVVRMGVGGLKMMIGLIKARSGITSKVLRV